MAVRLFVRALAASRFCNVRTIARITTLRRWELILPITTLRRWELNLPLLLLLLMLLLLLLLLLLRLLLLRRRRTWLLRCTSQVIERI